MAQQSRKNQMSHRVAKKAVTEINQVYVVHNVYCDQNGPFISPIKWDISVRCLSSDTLEHQIEWYGNNAVLNSTKMRL